MRSIKSTFYKIKNKNPNLGDYCVLCRAVEYRNFSKDTISSFFNSSIGPDDYGRGTKNKLIKELCKVSQTIRGAQDLKENSSTINLKK